MGIYGDMAGKVTNVVGQVAKNQQGLAAQSAGTNSNTTSMSDVSSAPVSGEGTTSLSGSINPATNSWMLGNSTNGSGPMNGQMTQSFGGGLAAMAYNGGNIQQQNANQYSIVGGAKMMV